MSDPGRARGWDRQAIMRVAHRDYGGLDRLFTAHDWDAGVRSKSQIASTLVVRDYGSAEAFETAHPEALPDPLDVIERGDVWLTSYYGYTPESWGYLGWTRPGWRSAFRRKSTPGALVVIYGTGSAPKPDERMRVLGVQQQSHILGYKRDFISSERWAAEVNAKDRLNSWKFGLRTARAWKVTPETRPAIQAFAPETYTPGRATVIGAQGLKLTAGEARTILDLDLVEVPVFGGQPIDGFLPGPAREVLRPSRPGPVSQAPHMVREAEGPKHLYILRLDGNADHLLGRSAGASAIVKVGFSRSPETRRADHNRALPACAFEWQIARSTFVDGREPFPSSRHALAGEAAIKDALEQAGESLGGEFFLADAPSIERAWTQGLTAAKSWTDA